MVLQALMPYPQCATWAELCETHLGSWPAVLRTVGLPKLLVWTDSPEQKWEVFATELNHTCREVENG
jgi:hypothetical protein